jgi:hypothetical protein
MPESSWRPCVLHETIPCSLQLLPTTPTTLLLSKYAATCPGSKSNLSSFEHKEARSGKVCPIQLSAPLLQELKDYRNMLGEYSVPYLFLANTGNFITPSVSTISHICGTWLGKVLVEPDFYIAWRKSFHAGNAWYVYVISRTVALSDMQDICLRMSIDGADVEIEVSII